MNKIITMNVFDRQIKVLTGEMHKWISAIGEIEDEYYIALATCENNIFMIDHTHIDGNDYNYIEHVVSGLPEFAKNYLINVIDNNDNLLIHLRRHSNNDSCYDIYYDCTCEDISINSLVNWMQLNNDFAAINYRYTEVKNGKQTIPQ